MHVIVTIHIPHCTTRHSSLVDGNAMERKSYLDKRVQGPRSLPVVIAAFVAVCRVLGLAPRPSHDPDHRVRRVLTSAIPAIIPSIYLCVYVTEIWTKVMQMEGRGLGSLALDVLVESLLFSSSLVLVVSFWTQSDGQCRKLIELTELTLTFLSSREKEEILRRLGNKMKLQFLLTVVYMLFYLTQCFTLDNVYTLVSSLFWYFSGLYLIVEVFQFANVSLYLLHVLQKINGTVASWVNYEQVFFSKSLLFSASADLNHAEVRSRYRVVKEMAETLTSFAELPLCLFFTSDFISVMLLLYVMTQVAAVAVIPTFFVMSLACCICLLTSICLPCHLVAEESRKTATLLSGVSLAVCPTSRAGVDVASLLLHVSHNPVTFSLLGTVNLNFELILSFIGTIITYLLVLVTFKPDLRLYIQLMEM